jgi:peptidoglycan/LPS O-acetylase OafA/YrhL
LVKMDIRSLTGLRGVAAVMVVLYHFWPVGPSPAPGFARAVGKGYLWVDLFFVLSGYVLALNYGSLFADRPFSPRAFVFFFMRRVARIYPAYIVLLLLQLGFVLLVYGNFGEPHHWGGAEALADPVYDLPANVLLVQSVGLAPSMIGQAWSISTEFAVYCAFPLLVTLAVFGSRQTAALALIAAFLLLLAVVVGDARDGAEHAGALDAYDGTHLTPLMRCLGDFILGLLAFRAGQRERLARLFACDAAGGMLLVALPAMFAAGAPDLAIVALFPALVLCLAGNTGVPAWMFANAPMVRLGELSYAIYLSHPLLQAPLDAARHGLEHVLPVLPAALLSRTAALAVLWLVAGAIYRWVERPGRQVLRHLGPMSVATGGESLLKSAP